MVLKRIEEIGTPKGFKWSRIFQPNLTEAPNLMTLSIDRLKELGFSGLRKGLEQLIKELRTGGKELKREVARLTSLSQAL